MKNIFLPLLSFLWLNAYSQNVGVDISTATRAKLEVPGVAGSGATAGIFGSDGAGISLQRNWPTIGFNQYRDVTTPGSQGKYMANGFAAIQYFDPSSGTMAIDMFASGTANSFTPVATRALTITATGNIGIRTGVANATLTVARGDGVDGTAVFTGTQHWSHFNYSSGEYTYIRAGIDGSNVYINKIPSGDVFVGGGNCRLLINNPSITPFYTVDLVQPVGVHSISLYDAIGYGWHQRLSHVNVSGQGDGNVLDFYYGGTARGRFQYWNGQYVVYSDRRLKTNIEPLPPVLERLKKLNAVSYEMKHDNPSHERTTGFIAQEVKPLFPGLIQQINYKQKSGDTLNGYQTMNYSGFGVLAIKALQEQWVQIHELEKENAAIFARLEELERKLK